MVSLGRSHYVALTMEGRVFTWGLNRDGQLGYGNDSNDLIILLLYGLIGVGSAFVH